MKEWVQGLLIGAAIAAVLVSVGLLLNMGWP